MSSQGSQGIPYNQPPGYGGYAPSMGPQPTHPYPINNNLGSQSGPGGMGAVQQPNYSGYTPSMGGPTSGYTAYPLNNNLGSPQMPQRSQPFYSGRMPMQYNDARQAPTYSEQAPQTANGIVLSEGRESAPSNPFASNQAAFNAAMSGNNTANAKPAWMQQGSIEQAPQSKAFSGIPTGQPPAPSKPPMPGPLPPQPTGPMQAGQVGWGFDNQRNQYLPQWNPAARQFIIGATHGSGVPAPWMNKGVQEAEYNDPNFMQMIQQKSGQTFKG